MLFLHLTFSLFLFIIMKDTLIGLLPDETALAQPNHEEASREQFHLNIPCSAFHPGIT